jgi:DNA-directed RNA polymerase subunit RPC12/RpoP
VVPPTCSSGEGIPLITNLHIAPSTTRLGDSVLRDGEQLNSIYVVVDSSKIARCKWCGIMQGEKWRYTAIGIFCSMECMYANGTRGNLEALIVWGALTLPLAAISALIHLGIAFGLFCCFLVLGLPLLSVHRRGMAHRRAVPKDSRANDVPLDTALLSTVTTSVTCPRCDAELDLRSIGEDRVYVCSYCGATGTITIVNKSEERRSDRVVSI